MPQTLLQVANSALIKIGSPTITSLDEETKQAELAKERTLSVRDKILRHYAWTFAKRITTLAYTGQSVAGWAYEFTLPEDCLKILRITSGGYDIQQFDLAGDKIYAQHPSIGLYYVAGPDEEGETEVTYPDDFAECWACYLASELSVALYEGQSVNQTYMQAYVKALSDARFNGAVEKPARAIQSSEWLDSRFSSRRADPDHRPLDLPPEGI